MATIFAELIVSHDETAANDSRDLYAETGYRELAAQKIMNFMRRCVSGANPCSILTRTNAVKATGTVTLSSFVNNDTVTINGVTFTGKTSPGANPEFAVGADDTAAAANLAAAINANTTTDGMLVATSALGVVTVTAIDPGELGNGITLAISAHGSVSAARMAGGTNGATETTHYFGSGS